MNAPIKPATVCDHCREDECVCLTPFELGADYARCARILAVCREIENETPDQRWLRLAGEALERMETK